MKKVISSILALVLALALTTCAFAATPSKSTSNMTYFTTYTPVEEEVTVTPVLEVVTTPEQAAVVEKELEKLIQVEKVEDYFVDAKGAKGEAIDLNKMLNVQAGEEVVVHDMTVITAKDVQSGVGDTKVVLQFPTAYKYGEKVVVLLGFEKADGTIEWIALEGVGEISLNAAEGAIGVVIPESLMMAIQLNTALVAIASK